MKSLALLCCLSCLALPVSAESIVPEQQQQNHWYQEAVAAMAKKRLTLMQNTPVSYQGGLTKTQPTAKKHRAKNVILFLGDGMGVSTVTAARILAGQRQGKMGEETLLSFEHFPYTGLSKTYNVNAQTPDSAGTMTAIMTGVKTDAGVVGVDEDVDFNQCRTVAGNELLTALELAELAGKKTGIISTMRVTHATPAATYAKSANRDWEDDAAMPVEAKAAGCEDIASQLVNFESRLQQQYPDNNVIDGIDLVMGGGRRHFLPADKQFNTVDASSEVEGHRQDGRNLIEEWQTQYPDGRYIIDQQGFDTLDTSSDKKVLALFNPSHMHYEADRANDKAGEPSLSAMTAKAIDILSQDDNGFFLMVEGGNIDPAHHAGNAFNALNETVEFANAVTAALEKVDTSDTLIIVTADHSHVFTLGGYAKRGNPILGKVVKYNEDDYAKDVNGKPYTAVAYANGLGFADYGDNTNADKRYSDKAVGGRQDLTDIDTTAPGYHQESLVPLLWETHGGEDVAIYAVGPGAEMVTGVNEQQVIFHMMTQAAEYEALIKQP